MFAEQHLDSLGLLNGLCHSDQELSKSREGHQNPICGLIVMAILLMGWILPIGGASSGRVRACSLRSRLIFLLRDLWLLNNPHTSFYVIVSRTQFVPNFLSHPDILKTDFLALSKFTLEKFSQEMYKNTWKVT